MVDGGEIRGDGVHAADTDGNDTIRVDSLSGGGGIYGGGGDDKIEGATSGEIIPFSTSNGRVQMSKGTYLDAGDGTDTCRTQGATSTQITANYSVPSGTVTGCER